MGPSGGEVGQEFVLEEGVTFQEKRAALRAALVNDSWVRTSGLHHVAAMGETVSMVLPGDVGLKILTASKASNNSVPVGLPSRLK